MQIIYLKNEVQFTDKNCVRVVLDVTQYSNERLWCEFIDENLCPVCNLYDYCFDITYKPHKCKFIDKNDNLILNMYASCFDKPLTPIQYGEQVKFKLINDVGKIVYLQFKVIDHDYNYHEFEFGDLSNNTLIAKGLI